MGRLGVRLFRYFKFSFLVALVVWLVWYLLLGFTDALLILKEYWQISVTMVFGSFIAGATSEGGGAIAFPVFTKLLNVNPFDAKVFSLAIQSVGMTAASLVIIKMKIKVEWRVIFWVSLGGVFGIVYSSLYVAPYLSPAMTKMSFTILVSSFALTLFVLNRDKLRLVNEVVPVNNSKVNAFLFLVGILGGVVSGMVGNGIDIITFSILVLWYRVNEKIATPTSVILMAINAIVGFLLYAQVLDGFTPVVQSYWLAAIPIVVIGAPLGAIVCGHLNRITIARVLLVLIAIEFVTSIWLIKLSHYLSIVSILLFLLFVTIYYIMYRSTTYDPKLIAGNNNEKN